MFWQDHFTTKRVAVMNFFNFTKRLTLFGIIFT